MIDFQLLLLTQGFRFGNSLNPVCCLIEQVNQISHTKVNLQLDKPFFYIHSYNESEKSSKPTGWKLYRK